MVEASDRTIRGTLRLVSERLTRYGIENGKGEAEWILSQVLGVRRLDLYLMDRPLSTEERRRIATILNRRTDREPLQYILGSVDFCGLKLFVNGDVLIPRPETEELVELIGLRVGRRKGFSSSLRILDLGTGSGAIVLALGKMFPAASLFAVDISPAALAVARRNYKCNGLKSPIRFLQSNWFDNVEGIFDLIVANPPYLTEMEWRNAQPEVREYEPRLALTPGGDGLADLKSIISSALTYLDRAGDLVLEIGSPQAKDLLEFSRSSGFCSGQVLKDSLRRDRFLFLRRSDQDGS